MTDPEPPDLDAATQDALPAIVLLQEGDIVELKEGHQVYVDRPNHDIFENRKGDYSLTHHEGTIGGELAHLAGRYIVTKTALEGGGAGGFHSGPSPRGHHVYCKRADHDGQAVDFYQTGSFTAMIKQLEPVGRAILTWTECPDPQEKTGDPS